MTEFVVCLGIAGVIVFFIVAAVKAAGNYRKLVELGVPARGIVLEVSKTASKLRASGYALEQRTIRLDVEIPGQAPYEVDTSITFPTNLRGDVLPGATVEVRVDPKNRNTVAIVGPGVGFTAALPVPPPTDPRSS